MPFRQAGRQDVAAVLELMSRYYAEDGYPFVEEEARSALLQLVRDASLGRLWVVEDGGVVLGYLAVTLGFSLEYAGRDAFIDELFIDAAARGRGLGREAVALAESYCRTAGVRAIHLEVESHRSAARRLYGKAGFRANGRSLLTKRLDSSGA